MQVGASARSTNANTSEVRLAAACRCRNVQTWRRAEPLVMPTCRQVSPEKPAILRFFEGYPIISQHLCGFLRPPLKGARSEQGRTHRRPGHAHQDVEG